MAVVSEAAKAGVDLVGGKVSYDYLSALAYMEYGVELAHDEIDYGAKNAKSSATGLYQFVDGTWLQFYRKYNKQYNLIPDADGKSDAEILAYRLDTNISGKFAAVFALELQGNGKRTFGRELNYTELYFGHLMGQPQSFSFIRIRASNPNADAALAFPREASTNPDVFFGTIEETYQRINTRMTSFLERVNDNR